MRYVQRGPEPCELSEYKACETEDWKPTYANFDKKQIVVLRLAREQGDICGYCGSRIGVHDARGWTKDCHIEHVEPQSTAPSRQLDYSNMLASCQGSEKRPPVPAHCGAKRGNTPLPVTPFMPDCGTYFYYGADGSIGSAPDIEISKQAAASETIRLLGLDVRRLQAARSAAIGAALTGVEELSADELLAEAQTYDKPDANGQLMPYCFVIQQVLRRYA